MIKKFGGDKYYCGLDIGTQSVKAAIIESHDHQRLALLGVYETRTSGYREASVTDLEELVECIQATMSGLSRKTKVKLKEVELGIGGELIQTRQSHAAIPLIDRGSKVITDRDIRKIQAQAKLLGTNMDEVLVHHFPQYYKVDDSNVATNPLGLYGRKMEMHSLLILTRDTVLKNLMTAVNQAGYDVANLYFSSYASGSACLTEDQKQGGCILVDIGTTLTGILMFKEGQFLELLTVPLGGGQITKNIAGELNLTFDLAEDIKKSYGCVMAPEPLGEEDILIKRDEGYLPLKKRRISQAIDPVSARLVDAIIAAIKGSPVCGQMNQGIILAGGGCLLSGLPERLEQETNLPVRMGYVPLAMKKLSYAPKFASAIGLAQCGIESPVTSLRAKQSGAGRIRRLGQRFKEFYQEYF